METAADDDTGLVSFHTDAQGNEMQINRDEVSQIIELRPVIEVSVLQAFRLRPVTVRRPRPAVTTITPQPSQFLLLSLCLPSAILLSLSGIS